MVLHFRATLADKSANLCEGPPPMASMRPVGGVRDAETRFGKPGGWVELLNQKSETWAVSSL